MVKNLVQKMAVGVFAASALFAVTTSQAQAQSTCNSETSCKRFVKCPVGFQTAKNNHTYSCNQQSQAATANPTCARLNNENDWNWSATHKKCRRVRNNGQEVLATENITCASGFTYSAASGKCTRPAGTLYARVQLASSATANVAPQPTGMCSSASACTNTVKCPSTFTMQTYPSDGYACKKTETASTQNPTCARLNNENDWNWSATHKKCRRVRNNGQEVLATENITCASGFTYSAASGKCAKPGGTFWSVPQL